MKHREFWEGIHKELDAFIRKRVGNSEDAFDDFIDALPGHYREPIRLTEMEGLTQQEMSRKLGLKLATAKSRVQRGRRFIQKMLLDCCHLEFDRRGTIVDYYKKAKR